MRLSSFLMLGLGLSVSPLVQAAEQKLATVEVTLDEAVAKDASGIRTLFVIVYDSDSPRPMPFGAMKVDLKADAKGSLYKGDLKVDLSSGNAGNVKVMGENSKLPKNIRLKARLDKDGSAGMDQPGDLVGKAEPFAVGGNAKIVINSKP